MKSLFPSVCSESCGLGEETVIFERVNVCCFRPNNKIIKHVIYPRSNAVGTVNAVQKIRT